MTATKATTAIVFDPSNIRTTSACDCDARLAVLAICDVTTRRRLNAHLARDELRHMPIALAIEAVLDATMPN